MVFRASPDSATRPNPRPRAKQPGTSHRACSKAASRASSSLSKDWTGCRRGRRASLPPADFHFAPPLAADGLQVTFVNKAGYATVYDFATLPLAEPFQCSLAAVFATRSRGWTSHATAKGLWGMVGAFSRFAAPLQPPPADLEDLTTGALRRWRLANRHRVRQVAEAGDPWWSSVTRGDR